MFRPLRISYDSSRYFRSFDGFRGYAIGGVFLWHCFLFQPFRPYMNWLWFGVDLFFVLSGFLITGILLETREERHCLRDFYVRRVLRIFPVYYGTLALYALYLIQFGGGRQQVLLQNLPWFWAYLQNYLFAFRGFSSGMPVAHFWSLAIEEQFYLVWPLLVTRLRVKPLLVLCVVASVFSCTLRQFDIEWPYAYMFTFTRLEGLMTGSAIALLIRNERAWLERVVPYVLPISGLGLAAVVSYHGSFRPEDEWVIRAGYTLMALFFGSLLVASLDEGRLGQLVRKFTGGSVLVFIGRYSYGMYVFHWLLHCELNQPLNERLSAHIDSRFLEAVTYTSIMAALTLGLSLASYHVFEQRFLRLKDVFAPRRAPT